MRSGHDVCYKRCPLCRPKWHNGSRKLKFTLNPRDTGKLPRNMLLRLNRDFKSTEVHLGIHINLLVMHAKTSFRWLTFREPDHIPFSPFCAQFEAFRICSYFNQNPFHSHLNRNGKRHKTWKLQALEMKLCQGFEKRHGSSSGNIML